MFKHRTWFFIRTYSVILTYSFCAFSNVEQSVTLTVLNYAHHRFDNIFDTLPPMVMHPFEIKGFIPVRFTFDNTSDATWIIAQHSSFACVDPRHVAYEMRKPMSPYFGLKIAGAGWLTWLVLEFMNPEQRARLVCMLSDYRLYKPQPYTFAWIMGCAFIGSCMHALEWYSLDEYNEWLEARIKTNSLCDLRLITPGQKTSMLVFIRTHDYYTQSGQYTVTLKDSENNHALLIFDINLKNYPCSSITRKINEFPIDQS